MAADRRRLRSAATACLLRRRRRLSSEGDGVGASVGACVGSRGIPGPVGQGGGIVPEPPPPDPPPFVVVTEPSPFEPSPFVVVIPGAAVVVPVTGWQLSTSAELPVNEKSLVPVQEPASSVIENSEASVNEKVTARSFCNCVSTLGLTGRSIESGLVELNVNRLDHFLPASSAILNSVLGLTTYSSKPLMLML